MILPISPVLNNIGGVMVSVLASSVVDLGSSRGQGHTKDYKIGICCKNWLAHNRNNVYEWDDPRIVVSVSYHYKKV